MPQASARAPAAARPPATSAPLTSIAVWSTAGRAAILRRRAGGPSSGRTIIGTAGDGTIGQRARPERSEDQDRVPAGQCDRSDPRGLAGSHGHHDRAEPQQDDAGEDQRLRHPGCQPTRAGQPLRGASADRTTERRRTWSSQRPTTRGADAEPGPYSGRHGGRHARMVTVRSVTSTSRRAWSWACAGTQRSSHRRVSSSAPSGITRERPGRVVGS